jgi:hypothetical protein
MRWLSLCLLIIATTFVSPESSAQTQPAKAPAQKGKKQARSGITQTPPLAPTTQPMGAQPQPVVSQTQSGNAQNQPTANQAQPPNSQIPPTNGQTQLQNAPTPEITGVNVFQTAATPDGNASLYLEINGQSLPTTSPVVFLAPQKGLIGPLDVVSAKDTQVIVKFTASKDYFPSTVGVGGTGGVIKTFDLDQSANVNSTLPRIDDVEVLELNRILGTGSIKIDGANLGSDLTEITVSIVPRDPTLPAFPLVRPQNSYSCPADNAQKQAAALTPRTAQDDVVVVDFSFPCLPGYSVPFRIARVILTRMDASGGSSSASYEMVPARDKNLTYRSTILSQKQTSSRFGGGIAKNFYAVQLSIVNSGPVKIQVPLASIQAEVQWFQGTVAGSKFYMEGPATVAPVPLTGAVSYFSTHRQATGARAIFFNTLQGMTTIGSAIQLFFGPGFAQGVGIAGGGLRQGLGQIFQDLSDQQLANLTSQSFESIETASGNGGSIEKVIFIQRGEEVLESIKLQGNNVTKFRRLIDNIQGFEITGYEVPETAAKAATPKP